MLTTDAAKAMKDKVPPQTGGLTPERTVRPGTGGRHAGILRMQRLVGNQAVNEIIQTKLTVSTPGDRFEQEADRVADQMLQTMPPRHVGTQSGGPNLQRKCDSCASGSGTCESCAKDEVVRLKPISSGATQAGHTLSGHESAGAMAPLQGGGAPLSSQERAFFEPRLGRDLSQVRIHSDATAAEAARSLQAQAYTTRHHIVFASGRYAPQTAGGKRLLAHELVHVIQQSAASSSASAHIQREPDPRVHPSSALPVHNREKASLEVEAIYRRGGLVQEAEAVRQCREYGRCDRILTDAEAYRLYSSGRSAAGLDKAQKGAAAPVAAGLVAPAAQGGAAAEGAVVKTAVERAAVQWGEATVLEGGTGAAAAEGTGAAVLSGVETGAAVAAGEILIPVAAGIFLILAVVDLVSYASFQTKLKAQGFVILPAPLACAIANCHQPSAPSFRPSPFPTAPTGPRFPFGKEPLSEADREAIEKWLGPRGSQPTPGPVAPQPVPHVGPQPGPRRHPDQTCDNDVLDKLQKKKDDICNSIPGESCSPSKVSPKRLARRPCSLIRVRIQSVKDCLKIRQDIQDKCFGGKPDAAHLKAMKELNDGLAHCVALAAVNCAPGHPMANL